MTTVGMFERALVGVYGGAKFVALSMMGDRASDEAVVSRRAVCRECPYRVRKVAPSALGESDWCGEPLVETARTCGCLIAGKTIIGSESCPQGKW